MSLRTMCQLALFSALSVPAAAHAILNVTLLDPCATRNATTCGSTTTWAQCSGNQAFRDACAPICDAARVAPSTCSTQSFYRTACGDWELKALESLGNGAAPRIASKCRATLQATAPLRSAVAERVLLPSDALRDSHAQATAVAGVAACRTGSGAQCTAYPFRTPGAVVSSVPLTDDLLGANMSRASLPPTVAGQTALEGQHAAWRQDGDPSSSCEEYVFHKYEGYSLFEDATLGVSDRTRTVFNVAYNLGSSALPAGDNRAHRAIGALGAIYDWRDAALRGADLFPGGLQPKNSFTAFPVTTAAVVNQVWTAPNGLQFTLQTRDPNAHNLVPSLVTPGLAAQVNALHDNAATQHQETFAWHQAMSAAAANAGLPDELLDRMQSIQQRYEGLNQERAQVLGDALKCNMVLTQPTTTVQAPWEIFDPAWDASQVLGDNSDTLGQIALAQMLGSANIQYFMPGSTSAMSCAVVWTAPLVNRLNALDARIESALLEAQSLGCLGNGLTACDWSPSLFQRRVADPFVAERQLDLDECRAAVVPAAGENVSQAFRRVAIKATPATAFAYNGQYASFRAPDPAGLPRDYVCSPMSAGGVVPNDGNFTRTPALVRTLLDCTRAYTQLVEGKLRAAMGPRSTVSRSPSPPLGDGTVKLGQTAGDRYKGGNDLFGVDVSYSAGWSLDKLSAGHMCDHAVGGVNGSAGVDVTVLGFPQQILSVKASLYAAQSTQTALVAGVNAGTGLSVVVLGQEIMNPNASVQFHGYSVGGNERRTPTFASVSQTFMIGPFPVRVAASATGELGVDYSLSSSCNASQLSIDGKLRPYASLAAQASAGVSALIAEAGIKVALTLADLSLPLTAQLAATLGANAMIGFDTQLDLDARFLEGRAALYAEVCYIVGCDSWDYELFSWGGIHTRAQLFNFEFTAPLAPLAGL